MSHRRHTSKISPAPPETRRSTRGGTDLVLRLALALAFGLVAVVSAQKALEFGKRQVALGISARVLSSGEDTAETIQRLRRVVTMSPDDGQARYFLGILLVRQEQRKAALPGGIRNVDPAVLDEAVKVHLKRALETSLFPQYAYMAIGQAALFGAEISKGSKDTAMVRYFGQQSVAAYHQALLLNPRPQGKSADFWIDMASAAEFSDRPDVALYALERMIATGAPAPTPVRGGRIPQLLQNAAVRLANAPLIAEALFTRWLGNPHDLEIWKQMYLLGGVPGGHAAAGYLINQVVRQFPDDPAAGELERSFRQGQPLPAPAPS